VLQGATMSTCLRFILSNVMVEFPETFVAAVRLHLNAEVEIL